MIPGTPRTKLHSKKKEKAAQLVANGGKTVAAMAKELEITERTLYRWLADPQLRARIEEIVQEYGAHVMNGNLATKKKQVAKLQELSSKIDAIIAERAADPRLRPLPGGSTGLVIIENVKPITERRVKLDANGEPILKVDPMTGVPLDPPEVETEMITHNYPFVVVDIALVQQQCRIVEQIGNILGHNVQRKEFSFRRIEDLPDDELFELEDRLLGPREDRPLVLEGNS